MMRQQQDTAQGAGTWEVERLRATTFHLPGADVPELTNWWEDVIGDKPEQMLRRPRESLVQQSGFFEGKQLVLSGRPDRFDWNLQVTPDPPDEPMQGLPTLGPFPDALQPLHKVVGEWLRVSPDAIRLAFGTVLIIRATDIPLAYKKLSQFLPKVEFAQADSSDFLYQINRPRTSKSGVGIRINRLTKWSVMQVGTIEIAIGPSAEQMLVSGPRQVACRLELDINTSAQSRNLIPRSETQALFEELVDLGSEIAANGDIP